MTTIPQTVACRFPGFETYHVTYNMMATAKQIEDLVGSLGQSDETARSIVILDHTGWPETEYPGGPFGENAPMAVLVWTVRHGFTQAVSEYVRNPFSPTA